MKSFFNQPSSNSEQKESPVQDPNSSLSGGLPTHYNGRVGIAAMAKKLSNRVNTLCNNSEIKFDGQGSTFDRRDFQSKTSNFFGNASLELESENKTLRNEIQDLQRMLMIQAKLNGLSRPQDSKIGLTRQASNFGSKVDIIGGTGGRPQSSHHTSSFLQKHSSRKQY